MLKLDIQLFAVPFRRTSKTRKRMRRTHYKITGNALTECSNCKAVIKPHRACPECGFYKGEKAVKVKDKNNA